MSKQIPLSQHPWVLVRLEWMREYKPSMLLELYKDGSLKKLVLSNVEMALEAYKMMIDDGMEKQFAEETALDQLAPAATDLPDEYDFDNPPISERLFEKIVVEVYGKKPKY